MRKEEIYVTKIRIKHVSHPQQIKIKLKEN